MNKVKKYLNFIRRYNFLRTLWIHKFVNTNLTGIRIYVSRKQYINIHDSAKILVKKGSLSLNESHTNTGYRNLNGQLVISNDAQLIVNGYCTVYEGCDININDGAKLEIGDHTYLNCSVKINCNEHIHIGNNCAISDFVQILETDFHTITTDNNAKTNTIPIKIGDHVWIGRSVITLKGVTIGDGAIIGAGSIVTHDIPSRCLAIGNPAKVIKENITWQ